MRKNKFILAGLLTVLLASCGGAGGEGSGEGTVKFSLMNSTNENPGWLAQIDKANELMKKDGVKVTIEPEIIKTNSWDEYYTKVAANMAGRTGGTIGRIAESHMPKMVEKTQLQDLTSIVTDLKNSGEFENQYFDGVAKSGDKYYGIPSGTQHMVLYYNKDTIDSYNKTHQSNPISYPSGDWNNPTTFDEIADIANKLSSGEGAARSFGLSAGPFLSYAGMYSKNSGGYNIFDDTGKPVINTQPFYDTYAWFDKMLKTDHSMPNVSDTQTSDALNRFLSGNIAMFVDGVWQLHEIVNYTEFNVGVAAIPVKTSGTAAYSTNFKDCYFAVRTSKNQKADQIALKYLMKADSIKALAEKSVGGFPICKSATTTFVDTLRDTKLSAYVDVIVGGKARTVDVPYSTYYNTVDQHINQKMSSWIKGEITHIQFVDYMQDTMVKGMNGEL